MSTIADTSFSRGFSKPSVHSLAFKDNFYDFALEIRDELLHHANWKEMAQEGVQGSDLFVPHRQNGITTGHIGRGDGGQLRHCVKFQEFLYQNMQALCSLIGVDAAQAQSVEMNAMAYGAGAWLSPHTDFSEYGQVENRLGAWMLYLTEPEDGEWSKEKGGAVRVWSAGGQEERIYPRFNRFAIFRVYRQSLHEIEKVTCQPEWPACRLALSGWIRGRPVAEPERNTRVYLESPSAHERGADIEARLSGSLAMYRLLAQQQAFCERDTSRTMGRIAALEEDYRAHCEAPPGTCFLKRIPGPAGCIIVVNQAEKVVHFGAPHGYSPKI